MKYITNSLNIQLLTISEIQRSELLKARHKLLNMFVILHRVEKIDGGKSC